MTDKLAELFDENEAVKKEKGVNTGALKAGGKMASGAIRGGVRTGAAPVRGAGGR